MTAPFDESMPACAWDPMVAPPCDTAPPDTSSQFTPVKIAMLVIIMLMINPFVLVTEVPGSAGAGARRGGQHALRISAIVHACLPHESNKA